MTKPASKIEFHYFFRDSSHTMDAFIRNECEKEILTIFREVSQFLDIDVKIESEAFKEGGLKEIWKFLGKNGIQLTLLLTVLQTILSRIPVENKELAQLQIENLKLDNELKKNELKKIKNELESKEQVTEEIIDKVLKILEKDYKIDWHKSNFYKKLNHYTKIVKLSSQKLDENNFPVEKERTVERHQFASFILRSNYFPPFVDEDATIDIISPVLKKGNFNWKGFYKGEIINFEMADQEFRESVLKKEIEFVNGTAIKCLLHQFRKIDETGLIKIVQSKVMTVFAVIDNDTLFQTQQGEIYKRGKKGLEKQLSINFI